jgi:hypothetical protein
MPSHILKVTIAHIRPAITRKLRVPSAFTLADLHQVLQIAFGWEDCHLHEFRIDGAVYGVPHPDDERDLIDENTVSLDEALPRRRATAEYIYDFGDHWIHKITVEQREAAVPPLRSRSLRRPTSSAPVACLEAKRACPPEDCGGPFGYGVLLEALADPEHERHTELTDWIGGVFDPERVSLAEINKRLGAFGR